MIHVAIDARLADQGQGGVQQVIRSLAEGFRLIENSDIKRSWIVYKGTRWWEGVFPPEDNLIVINPPFGKISILIANRAPKIISLIYPILSKLKSRKPPFDNRLRALHVDVVHMPFQDGFTTDLPYVYHPHDLQHKYFPANFSKAQLNHRDQVWKKLAVNAKMVMAASTIVQDDLIKFWMIEKSKICVVPVPPPTRTFECGTSNPFQKMEYLIYPAVFWPHKNHVTLVYALKELVAKFPNIKCIFAGSKGSEQSRIKKLVQDLDLTETICFAGHVPEELYGTLLRNSKAVVIPSLFEALSLTVIDALNLGKLVVCSDIPAFRLQDKADMIFFNPENHEDLCEKLEAISESAPYEKPWSLEAYNENCKQNLLDLVSHFESIYRSMI